MLNDLPDIAGQSLSDTQSGRDDRRLAIDKVGVKGIKFPIAVRDKNTHSLVHCTGDFELFAHLAPDNKGSHMSRFIEILHSHGKIISVDSFKEITQEVRNRLDSERADLKVAFTYFREKESPVSKIKSLMDYEVELECSVTETTHSYQVTVHTYGTSLCPCSKEISDYGAHNQRSKVSISVTTSDTVWIEDLIDIAEAQMSCQVFGILKRPDEKWVTEHAYDNPKFVEDMIRDTAIGVINQLDGRYKCCHIEVENYESIHNHSAYAQMSFDHP
jgi:GTP cyclohydrolase IB